MFLSELFSFIPPQFVNTCTDYMNTSADIPPSCVTVATLLLSHSHSQFIFSAILPSHLLWESDSIAASPAADLVDRDCFLPLLLSTS